MVLPGPHLTQNHGLIYRHGPSQTQAKAQTSRCCNEPAEDTYVWHCYWYSEHPGLIELAQWLSGLTPKMRESVLGEIEALLDAAQAGKLSPRDEGEPIKAIELHQHFFEIRADLSTFDQATRLFRQYHAEPPEEDFDNMLVVSHAHLKQVDGLTRTQQNKLQDKELEQANNRYLAGKPSEWGLNKPGAEPAHPMDTLIDLIETFDTPPNSQED